MKTGKSFFILLMFLLLNGCATTPKNIPLADSFWQDRKQQVVVAKATSTKPVYYAWGNQGILDILITEALTKKFQAHIDCFEAFEVSQLQEIFVQRLREHKIKAIKSPQLINKETFQKNNVFSVKVDGDKLLVLRIVSLGAERHYYSFAPTGAPLAFCNIEGQLINLKDNQILWRYNAMVKTEVKGKWNQPPDYPNFTLALKEAVEIAEQEVTNNFFGQR